MRNLIAWIGIIIALAAAPGHAGAPLPSLVFYGMLVDEFGWPYESNVRVEVHSQGVPIFTKSISPARGRDYNFLVRLPYDSGIGDETYSGNALIPGELIDLKIVALETGAVLINTNFVVSFPPGAVFNVNLTAGTDSLGDGIPDELRRWIWMNTGIPGPFNPNNIRATDDSDLDGVNNLNEYRAGTDPANSEDVLQLEVTASSVPGIGELSFYTVPGKLYQIQSGSLAPDGLWSLASFANSPASAPIHTDFLGTGHFVSLFVPAPEGNSFYRVFVAGKNGSSIVP